MLVKYDLTLWLCWYCCCCCWAAICCRMSSSIIWCWSANRCSIFSRSFSLCGTFVSARWIFSYVVLSTPGWSDHAIRLNSLLLDRGLPQFVQSLLSLHHCVLTLSPLSSQTAVTVSDYPCTDCTRILNHCFTGDPAHCANYIQNALYVHITMSDNHVGPPFRRYLTECPESSSSGSYLSGDPLFHRYLVGGFILSSWSCRSAGGCIYYARIMALSECLWLGPVYNTIFYSGYWAHN